MPLVSTLQHALSQLNTEALACARPTTPIELQRTILANRAQTWILYGGLVQEALRDIDRALFAQYSNQDSPKPLTAKYHFRRAKLLCLMARYDEAQAEFSKSVDLIRDFKLDVAMGNGSDELAKVISRGKEASEDSERRRKDELLRAVDV
jgi:tetratricopeptide (TPR) repeat protein